MGTWAWKGPGLVPTYQLQRRSFGNQKNKNINHLLEWKMEGVVRKIRI
jgi:hypothetical protein